MPQPAVRIAQLWRYPVKSMAGEQMPQAAVSERGIPLDRGWAVRCEKAGTIRSARYIPQLLMCSARYLEGTDAGLVPHVEITLPDGSAVNSDDSRANQRLSDALGRPVTLWSLRSPDETEHLVKGPKAMETRSADEERRMLMGLKEGEPLPDFSRIPKHMLKDMAELAAPRGTYFDLFPISILTMAAIRHLQQFLPDVDLNERRFRPNILLEDDEAATGLMEREWVGQTVSCGEASFDVVMDVPRCTIIAAEHPGLRKETTITRAIVREMKQCIALYCTVRNSGLVHVGDRFCVHS